MVKFEGGKSPSAGSGRERHAISIGKLSKDDQKFVRERAGETQEDVRGPGRRRQRVAAGGGANWPGWLGPNRDGKSPDTGLLKQWPEGGPPLLWKATGIGRGYSSVTVVDGLVYITGVVGNSEV